MAEIAGITRFNGGIADSLKEGIRGSYAFAQAIDTQSEPSQFTPLPGGVLERGTENIGVFKWMVSALPFRSSVFGITEAGRIYETIIGSGIWNLIGTVPSSIGQGLEVFNDFLYYISGTNLGRYGPLSGSPTFNHTFQSGLQSTVEAVYAPIKAFKTGIVVGHGNFIGWYDGSTWTANQLQLPSSQWARSIRLSGDMVAIGCARYPLNRSNQGYVVLWDGLSKFPNDFLAVDSGAVSAVIDLEGTLMVIAGTKGIISSGGRPFVRQFRIPGVDSSSLVEVAPGAVDSRDGQALIGVGASAPGDYVRGVYSIGSKTDRYANALTCDYIPSHGDTGEGTQIASILALGEVLYVSWGNGNLTGVDAFTISGSPSPYAKLRSMIFDDSRPGKLKKGISLKAAHLPLKAGDSCSIWVSIDREDWKEVVTNTEAGSKETKGDLVQNLQYPDFYEIQWEVRIQGQTTVTFTGIEYEPNRESRTI